MEVEAKGDWTAYLCESYIGVHAKNDFSQSNYCKERSAHAATKRELESLKDLRQQCLNSVTMICVTFPNAAEYVGQLEKQRDAAEARGRELENTKLNLNHRLEVYKAEIRDLYRSIDPLKSRVRELEGLSSQVVKAWKAFDLAEGDWERTDSERALSNSITTLGEALPRKDPNAPQS